MKTSGLCSKILSIFFFIFNFSASSISATFNMESTFTFDPKIFILSWSMGVLATRTLGASFRLGHPVEICFSRINPSARNESLRVPPAFLMSLMYSRLPLPFNLRTASTHKLAKCSLSCKSSLLLRVVRAIYFKSSLNFSSSDELSKAVALKAFKASSLANLNPAMMI